jgi:DNA-binding NtrC family response regulator
MAKEAVVILDRELHSQWTLKTLLEAQKYIVSAVTTKQMALNLFSDIEASALITEYWVDQSSCLDVLPELRQRAPGLYIMMLTDRDVVESEYEQIIRAGVDDFFLKPVGFQRILVHLEKGLKQRRIFLERRRFEERLRHLKRTEVHGRNFAQAVLDH